MNKFKYLLLAASLFASSAVFTSCDDMNVDKELLVKKLKAAGFEYSKENNKFW